MKKVVMSLTILLALGSLLVLFAFTRIKRTKTPTGVKSIYEFTLKTIDGQDLSLSKFKGKKMLIVNVASECGYTPQYKGLQELHEKYKDKLEIIGFPANDFGAQEPGSNTEIKQFCFK